MQACTSNFRIGVVVLYMKFQSNYQLFVIHHNQKHDNFPTEVTSIFYKFDYWWLYSWAVFKYISELTTRKLSIITHRPFWKCLKNDIIVTSKCMSIFHLFAVYCESISDVILMFENDRNPTFK